MYIVIHVSSGVIDLSAIEYFSKITNALEIAEANGGEVKFVRNGQYGPIFMAESNDIDSYVITIP